MKKLIAALVLATVASGCVTAYRNDGGDMDLKPEIVRDRVYEKFELGDKPVTATEQSIGIMPFGLFNMFNVGGMARHYSDDVQQKGFNQESIMRAKSGAYAMACEQAGCDSIVGTRYQVDYKWYFLWNEATVTVTGYPAKRTGVEVHKINPAGCRCK